MFAEGAAPIADCLGCFIKDFLLCLLNFFGKQAIIPSDEFIAGGIIAFIKRLFEERIEVFAVDINQFVGIFKPSLIVND